MSEEIGTEIEIVFAHEIGEIDEDLRGAEVEIIEDVEDRIRGIIPLLEEDEIVEGTREEGEGMSSMRKWNASDRRISV